MFKSYYLNYRKLFHLAKKVGGFHVLFIVYIGLIFYEDY